MKDQEKYFYWFFSVLEKHVRLLREASFLNYFVPTIFPAMKNMAHMDFLNL